MVAFNSLQFLGRINQRRCWTPSLLHPNPSQQNGAVPARVFLLCKPNNCHWKNRVFARFGTILDILKFSPTEENLFSRF